MDVEIYRMTEEVTLPDSEYVIFDDLKEGSVSFRVNVFIHKEELFKTRKDYETRREFLFRKGYLLVKEDNLYEYFEKKRKYCIISSSLNGEVPRMISNEEIKDPHVYKWEKTIKGESPSLGSVPLEAKIVEVDDKLVRGFCESCGKPIVDGGCSEGNVECETMCESCTKESSK